VNDELGDMKARLRNAEQLLAREGGAGNHVALAQAISRTRRLLRHADRGLAPGTDLRRSMTEVDMLAAGAR
jgi:hypothetical protein